MFIANTSISTASRIDKSGRLQLKSPAELIAARAQDRERAGERPERQQHAEREHESVRDDLAALVAGLVDEAEDLDPEHRETRTASD